MTARSLLGFILLLLAVGWVAPALAAERGLVVLVYHHLADPVDGDVTVTPAEFARQLEDLQAAGVTFFTVEQAMRYLAGAMPGRPRHPVLITFDDGYESNYLHAFPVLQRLRIPAVIFVVTSRLGTKPQFLRYLSLAHISEMARSGLVQFGSHTHAMHDQLRLRYLQAVQQGQEARFVADLRADLRQSRAVLASATGQLPLALAWPYGSFNARMTRVAREVGFVLHATSVPGSNEVGTDPLWIKRYPVTCRDTTATLRRKVGLPPP